MAVVLNLWVTVVGFFLFLPLFIFASPILQFVFVTKKGRAEFLLHLLLVLQLKCPALLLSRNMQAFHAPTEHFN
jgi:hypothetical protein